MMTKTMAMMECLFWERRWSKRGLYIILLFIYHNIYLSNSRWSILVNANGSVWCWSETRGTQLRCYVLGILDLTPSLQVRSQDLPPNTRAVITGLFNCMLKGWKPRRSPSPISSTSIPTRPSLAFLSSCIAFPINYKYLTMSMVMLSRLLMFVFMCGWRMMSKMMIKKQAYRRGKPPRWSENQHLP